MPRGQLLSYVTKVTKGTNKGLCPLFIPKGLCSATKDAPNPPDYVSFPLNVSNVIFLRARRKENDAQLCSASYVFDVSKKRYRLLALAKKAQAAFLGVSHTLTLRLIDSVGYALEKT